MKRITIKHLQAVVDRINAVTGSPASAYVKQSDGSHEAQIGNYHLSQAYGGVCLHRMFNKDGGVDCPIGNGHIPKRELYDQMQAYLRGLEQRDEVKA